MEIKELKDKLVAVLGYGLEGKTVTQYLSGHGLKPVLFDQKPWDQWPAKEQKAIKALGLRFIFGPDCFLELRGFDVAFRSPGIKLLEIENLGLKVVTSQTKWFFEHCPAKIIGVTGTKGKGTTATLIFEILRKNFQSSNFELQKKSKAKPQNSKIYLTGNIGNTQPLEILNNLQKDDWVVYELSSFQLQDLRQSPHIGVVLMVTGEHLDYHKNLREYLKAKEAIVKFQKPSDFAVINSDFPRSRKIGELSPGEKYYFSRQKPLNPGMFVENGKLIYQNPKRLRREILETADLRLRGGHNLENVCAAALAAHLAGAGFETIKQASLKFKGLKHRIEFVAEKTGIKFYDDSFSTTPETAIAAIASFKEPEILILGGSFKGANFNGLGKTISRSRNIKKIILIGQEATRIKQAILNSQTRVADDFILEKAKNMREIFLQLKTVAQKGDVVLLSPACASFDMFKNYKDRGRQFKILALNWQP